MKKFAIFCIAALIAVGFAACRKEDVGPRYYYLWQYDYNVGDYVVSSSSYIKLDGDGNGSLTREGIEEAETFLYSIDGTEITFDYRDRQRKGALRNGVIFTDNKYYCLDGVSSPVKSNDNFFYSIGIDGNYLISGVRNDDITSVTVPSEIDGIKVTAIGPNAFSDCEKLVSAVLPDGINEIGNNAFRSCGSLKDITFPKTLKHICSNAFEYCKELSGVVLPEGLEIIDTFAFRGCSMMKSVGLPRSLTTIGYNAFANCASLQEIDIPEGVTEIQTGAFQNCPELKKITVNENNKTFKAINNCLIEKATSTLVFGCAGSEFINDGSVKHIGANAFIGGYSGETLRIDGVETIGENSFAGCKNIKYLYIDGVSVKIDPSAFANCSSLAVLEITGDVELAQNAFSGCSALSELNISGVTEIGSNAFGGCLSLTSVKLPDSVISISENAFANCSGLTSFEISRNVEKIGTGVFHGCYDLVTLTVSPENELFYSQDNCLIERSSLVLVAGCMSSVIPSNVKCIAASAFKGCRIKEIVVPDSVTEIYSSAFQDCIYLEQITLGRSLVSISDYAFYGCGALENIYYNGNRSDWNKVAKGTYWIEDNSSYSMRFIER